MNKLDTIDYFQPNLLKKELTIEFTCSTMITPDLMILGTKNGEIIGYNIFENQTKIFKAKKKILNQSIQDINFIENYYHLILFSDNNLYYYNEGKNILVEIIRNISFYELHIQQNEYYAYVLQDNEIKQSNLKDLIKTNNKKDAKFISVLSYKHPLKLFKKIEDKFLLHLKSEKVLIYKPDTGERCQNSFSFKEKKITHVLENGSILVLTKYDNPNDKNQWTNIVIFLSNDILMEEKNSINFISEEEIQMINSNNDYVVFSSKLFHFVCSLQGNMIVQKLSFFDDNKRNYIENISILGIQSLLFAYSKDYLFSFKTLEPFEIINEVKKTLNFKPAVEILQNLKNIKPIDQKRKIHQIYSLCAWELLQSQFMEIQIKCIECFNHINFDPEEVIKEIEINYSLNNEFEIISIENQKLTILYSLLKKKREAVLKLLAINEDYIIDSQDIVRKKQSHQAELNVKAINWIQIIDYAIIRIFVQQNEFNNLFNFLNNNKVYCINKNDNLTKIIKNLELIYNENKSIKFLNYIPSIMVEIQLLKNEYKQALQILKEISLNIKQSKNTNFNQYIKEKIKHIFETNQKSALFDQLLDENFDWLVNGSLKRRRIINVDEKVLDKEDFLSKFDTLKDKTQAFQQKKKFLIQLKNNNQQNLQVNNQYVIAMIQSIEQDYPLENLKDLKNFLEDPENQMDSLKILNQLKKQKDYINNIIKEYNSNEKIQKQMKCYFFIIQSLIYKRIYYETLADKNIDSEKYIIDGMDLLYQNEPELTEAYCADQTLYNNNFKQLDQNKPGLFLLNKLIEKYINNNNKQNNKIDLKNKINQLLIKYSNNKNLDIGQLINVLEDDYFVYDINFLDFLEKSIIELDQEEKKQLLKKQITDAQLNKISSEYELQRRRWIIIDENTKCAKCQETIRTLLFKVYPNGVIVDCACGNKVENKNVCPVTYQDFSKSSYVQIYFNLKYFFF